MAWKRVVRRLAIAAGVAGGLIAVAVGTLVFLMWRDSRARYQDGELVGGKLKWEIAGGQSRYKEIGREWQK